MNDDPTTTTNAPRAEGAASKPLAVTPVRPVRRTVEPASHGGYRGDVQPVRLDDASGVSAEVRAAEERERARVAEFAMLRRHVEKGMALRLARIVVEIANYALSVAVALTHVRGWHKATVIVSWTRVAALLAALALVAATAWLDPRIIVALWGLRFGWMEFARVVVLVALVGLSAYVAIEASRGMSNDTKLHSAVTGVIALTHAMALPTLARDVAATFLDEPNISEVRLF